MLLVYGSSCDMTVGCVVMYTYVQGAIERARERERERERDIYKTKQTINTWIRNYIYTYIYIDYISKIYIKQMT